MAMHGTTRRDAHAPSCSAAPARRWLARACSCGAAARRTRPPPSRSRPSRSTTTLDRIEITALGEAYEGRGDALQIETAPGADGVRGPHVGAGGDARHQPELVRVRAHQHHRQADRALAGRGPLRHRRLGRGVARPRRAAHRCRHALGRLRARAHQERPRRRVPPHAGARPDRHLRRRARLRPLRAPLPVEGHRVRAEEPRPPALQRHHAGHHRPARHLPDRGVRRQPQGHLPDRGHLHLVRAGLPVRRLRLLAQAVQRAPRGERAIPRRHRGRHGGDACSIFLYTFLRLGAWHGFVRMLLWLVDGGAARARRRGLPRSAAGRHVRPPLQHRHRRRRRGADAVPGAARAGPRAVAGADLDAAAGVAVRRRRHLHRAAVGRHRRVRPHGRAWC